MGGDVGKVGSVSLHARHGSVLLAAFRDPNAWGTNGSPAPSGCRAALSKALMVTARRWAAVVAPTEADRLTPVVESLSQR